MFGRNKGNNAYYLSLIACLVYQVLASEQLTLSNKNLVVAVEPWPPGIVEHEHKNGTKTYSGIIWEIMEYIKEARNCTFNFVRAPDTDTDKWGHCVGINNCTGMLGQVNRKEVDLALGLQLIVYV